MLYIIRHGQTRLNRERRWNCQADEEEVASMKRMYARGIDVYYRLVAEQGRIELKDQLGA